MEWRVGGLFFNPYNNIIYKPAIICIGKEAFCFRINSIKMPLVFINPYCYDILILINRIKIDNPTHKICLYYGLYIIFLIPLKHTALNGRSCHELYD